LPSSGAADDDFGPEFFDDGVRDDAYELGRVQRPQVLAGELRVHVGRVEAGLMNLWLYFCGIVAESICCQMLCLNSLASVDEAVKTILGEAIRGTFIRLSVLDWMSRG
jgi:hypothetical protein